MPPTRNQGQSRRWVFTINNPTDLDTTHLIRLAGNSDYLVFGREVGENGTPHLQGFVIFRSNQRFTAARGLIGGRAHIEPARGTSQQAAEYCKKDGDYNEYGTLPSASGRRTDLEDLIQWLDDFERDNDRPATSPDLAKHHPAAYLKFPRLSRLADRRARPRALQFGDPRPWQSDLDQELDETSEDDRKIIFIVDQQGNKGKSWFCRWFMTRNPDKTQVLGIGKRDDLTYVVDERKSVYLFVVPRGQMEFLQYSVLEQLKDRMMMSTKYQSKTKTWKDNNHVVVFSNEAPDLEKMSADRFDIRYLD